MIRAHQPKSLVNRSGYELAGVLTDEHLDMPRLLAGSEGTLALFSEITVKTHPLPKHVGTVLFFFDLLEKAARAVEEIMPSHPSACDVMDRRHLSLARESDPRYASIIPAEAEALLLIELEGQDPQELRERMRQLTDRVRRRKRLAFDSRSAFGHDDRELSWRLAQKVVPTLYRLKGSTQALPFVEDIAIPPAALAPFLVEMQNVLKRHQVTASLFGHAAHGQLHIRPFLNPADPEHVKTMAALATELYEAVFQAGGSISGEHGDGLSRTQFVARQYGELYPVLREVKRIFDPRNVLNPGKVIGDDPDLMTRNLRPTVIPCAGGAARTNRRARRRAPRVDRAGIELDRGRVGRSRHELQRLRRVPSQDATVRMCPIFRFAPGEEASPRAKANLIRAVLTGALAPQTLASDAFKTVADLCVNCQMCRLECPASVDIPKLMIEAKANYVATNGLRLDDWIMTRLETVGAVGGLFSPVTNWIIRNRQARWIVEKAFGIAQRRKLPRFAPRSFLRRAVRRRLTQPTRRSGRKVLYFVDVYANYHDPQLAEAFVAVLEHNGVPVFAHPDQRASGMALVSRGAIDPARKIAAANVSHSGRGNPPRLRDRHGRAFGRALPDARIPAAVG